MPAVNFSAADERFFFWALFLIKNINSVVLVEVCFGKETNIGFTLKEGECGTE